LVLDLPTLFARFALPAVGVVHVGGVDGSEDPSYVAMGFTHRLFVEAQPDTFATLAQRLARTGADCEQVAISNTIGSASFHVASFAQSSSLLSLAAHQSAYPGIVEQQVIEAPCPRSTNGAPARSI
jgi:hypothetical protein